MTFAHSIVIRAGAPELFWLTQDYSRRLAWDPFLRSAELLGGAAAVAVGVRAYCVAKSGAGMETEYVSFTPPRAAAVKMTRGPWFLASFAGSWRFDRDDNDTDDARDPGGAVATRVSFRYHLEASPTWLAALLGPLLRWSFARDTRKRLAALKAAVEHAGPGQT